MRARYQDDAGKNEYPFRSIGQSLGAGGGLVESRQSLPRLPIDLALGGCGCFSAQDGDYKKSHQRCGRTDSGVGRCLHLYSPHG